MMESPWYVVLTQPQQDIQTVWRLHELGLELYVPIVRERRPTKKKDHCGRKVVVLHPRPMFPGYGFIRHTEVRSFSEILETKGVRELLRDQGRPIILPHHVVMGIRQTEVAKHQEMLRAKGARASRFKKGDAVRVDEGSVYTGLTSNIDQIDAKGRLKLFFGLIAHWVPADMVVAA